MTYFFFIKKDSPVGCVAIEMASGELAYMERLAVLPAHRRMGIGLKLAGQALGLAQSNVAEIVSVGIISARKELKNWYLKIGFKEGDTKSFDHLPFMVTFMSYVF